MYIGSIYHNLYLNTRRNKQIVDLDYRLQMCSVQKCILQGSKNFYFKVFEINFFLLSMYDAQVC